MNNQTLIHQATLNDLNAICEIALLLWLEDNSMLLIRQEISQILADNKAVIFIASKNGDDVGFAHYQIRYDYVEGTVTTPVGYLEGIFVKEEHRLFGVGTKLIRASEEWLRTKNITEIASDTEIFNSASKQFHIKQGFSDVNRIVCFSKRI